MSAYQDAMDELQIDSLLPAYAGTLNPNKGWKSIFLRCFGWSSEIASTAFPKTMALLNRVDSTSLTTTIHSALFSILDPQTPIRPHRGFIGGVLTYHLSLAVE